MAKRRGGVAALALTLAGGTVAALLLFWPHLLVRGCLKRIFPGMLWEIATKAPLAALTVDDGPDPVYTPQLLEILKRENIQATFFVVGERARAYPQLIEAICSGGHEIGNHTDTWRNTLRVGRADFEPDFLRAGRAIVKAGCATRFFRPAGIWIKRSQLEVVQRHGYRCVVGSAYAYDPARPPAAYISSVIGRALRPGAIIVIHDSGGERSRTINAVPAIVKRAREKGLRLVKLSALLAAQSER